MPDGAPLSLSLSGAPDGAVAALRSATSRSEWPLAAQIARLLANLAYQGEHKPVVSAAGAECALAGVMAAALVGREVEATAVLVESAAAILPRCNRGVSLLSTAPLSRCRPGVHTAGTREPRVWCLAARPVPAGAP